MAVRVRQIPSFGLVEGNLELSNSTLAAQPVRVAAPLRPWYLVAAAAAFAVMIAAILGPSLWFLNFVHVMAGALWTGIDLFMGFVIGPILRGVSLETRRTIISGPDPAHADPDANFVDRHLDRRLVPRGANGIS